MQLCLILHMRVYVDDVFIWCVRTAAGDPQYRSKGGQDVHSRPDFVHTEN